MLMNPNPRASQQGSSLIEVLVAVVILSLGMLSMLWAITKSMSFQRTAEFRNIASQYALDYADRVRANAQAYQNYVYRQAYDPRARVNDPAKNCAVTGQVCSAAEMAAFDQFMIRRHISSSLPAGGLYVESPGSNRLSIWVIWQQPDQFAQDEPDPQTGRQAPNPLSTVSQCPAGARISDPSTQCQFLGVRL